MTGFFYSFNEFVPLSIVSVPEPSTWMLVGTGLLGLLALRRRRSLSLFFELILTLRVVLLTGRPVCFW